MSTLPKGNEVSSTPSFPPTCSKDNTVPYADRADEGEKHVATCLQFGPRFLHSTGQAYKGGPNSGVFLQITAQPTPDLAIPGRVASFGVIEAAQARGDFRVLAERGRRVLRAHIVRNVDEGIAAIAEAARSALE